MGIREMIKEGVFGHVSGSSSDDDVDFIDDGSVHDMESDEDMGEEEEGEDSFEEKYGEPRFEVIEETPMEENIKS